MKRIRCGLRDGMKIIIKCLNRGGIIRREEVVRRITLSAYLRNLETMGTRGRSEVNIMHSKRSRTEHLEGTSEATARLERR